MSLFVASAHILQKVISTEESNGVIKFVDGKFLNKESGKSVEIKLPYDQYMTARGANNALEIYKNGGKRRERDPLSEEEEDEVVEEEGGTRRSKRIKDKKKLDIAKESDPPSSNENKLAKTKTKGPKKSNPKKDEKGSDEGKNAPPHKIESDGEDTDELNSDIELIPAQDEPNNKDGALDYLREEITTDTDGGVLYNLMEKYREVCALDSAWVNKQLRKLDTEPPKPIATDLIAKIELEGKLMVPDDNDMAKGANWRVDMVMYNLKDLSTKGVEDITKCKALDIDFSGGVSTACIRFRIKGIFNGIRAIINTARSGKPVDLYFKQSLDNYDKLRSIYINNTPQEIKNQSLWKEALKNELDSYGTVVDTMILKKIVTVTFARPREAAFFERKIVPLSIAGFNVTASRTPFTILRTPSDVVVEGLYNDDLEEALEAIATETTGICRVAVVCRKDRGALVLTFTNHSKADEFVKRRKMTIERGQSNITMEVNIEWGRDSNTRKAKKDDTEATPADSTVLAKLTALDNKLKEDKKAGLAELRRLEKERAKQEKIRQQERKEDQLFVLQMIADSQNKVLSVVGNTLASIADKQATLECISDEITDYRGERQLINFQLINANMEMDPNKFEALNKRRAELDEKISILNAKRTSIAAERVTFPALPPVTLPTLSLPSPKFKDASNGQKRNVEVMYVAPDKPLVDQLTDILNAREGNRVEASSEAWVSIFEHIIKKNLMQMSEVWTFLLPIGVVEKELIISKFQAFLTVFLGTHEAKIAGNIVEYLERAVLKEIEATKGKSSAKK